jgi:hypothetical protein
MFGEAFPTTGGNQVVGELPRFSIRLHALTKVLEWPNFPSGNQHGGLGYG